MKFALLGDDPQALALARAAAYGPHQLAWIGEAAGAADLLRTIAPRATRDTPWESLLDNRTADVVIVGRSADEDRRADQLRKLVQVGVPLLVTHPGSSSMLVCYELEMIRCETGCIMRHYSHGRLHPAITVLADLVAGRSNEIGAVEQIVFARALPQRDKRTVLEQFARDVDLVTMVAGDINKIGALGAADDEAAYATLSVQMSGVSATGLRWSVQPVDEQTGGTLSLLGTAGRTVLQMPLTDQPWTLEQTVGSQTERTVYSDWDEPAAAIEAMVKAVDERADASTWSEAARTVGLAEAIERSLKKGRTIELYEQEFSEQSTFRGMMTSLGCGLLIAMLLLIPLVGVLVKILEDLGAPEWLMGAIGSWPWWMLAVFVVFLLLQLLPKFVLPADGNKQEKR